MLFNSDKFVVNLSILFLYSLIVLFNAFNSNITTSKFFFKRL